MSEKLVLTLKPIGENGLFEIRNQLDNFVGENFDLLYEGASRTGDAISGDCYAPRRIQINSTRLHARIPLKYANGHKYSREYAPSEEDLRQTVKDIQTLIDAASETIPKPFELKIIEK